MNRRTTHRSRRAAAAVILTIAALTSQFSAPSPAGATSPPEAPQLASGMAGVHGEITRLYLALLDRAPEDDGLSYWVSQRRGGSSLRGVVAFFRNSPEFEARFGSMVGASTEAWVDFVYQQVLGRQSDAAGKAFWVELIESGSASKEDLIIHFSESPEFQIITGTGLIGFLHAVEESEGLYALQGDSYVYSSSGSSYWARVTTTITVIDGVVVERSYEHDWYWDGEIDEAWTETGADLGSHDEGAPLATVPEVHDQCQELLQTLDPLAHELSLWLDDDGKMSGCGGVHLLIADAVDPTVEIHDFEVLGDEE